jgi:hypothetical protein
MEEIEHQGTTTFIPEAREEQNFMFGKSRTTFETKQLSSIGQAELWNSRFGGEHGSSIDLIFYLLEIVYYKNERVCLTLDD